MKAAILSGFVTVAFLSCLCNGQIENSNTTLTPVGDEDEDEDEDEDVMQLEQDFKAYLLIGVSSSVFGVVATIVCVVLIIKGKFSGDLRNRVPRGRGVQFVKQRIPQMIARPMYRYLPAQPPPAMARSPSVHSVRVSRQPSRSSIRRHSAVSLSRPTASQSFGAEPSSSSVSARSSHATSSGVHSSMSHSRY